MECDKLIALPSVANQSSVARIARVTVFTAIISKDRLIVEDTLQFRTAYCRYLLKQPVYGLFPSALIS